MATHRSDSPADIPIFKLYGEDDHWPTPDLIHCESIAERSRLHDWEIAPHRHTDLLQVLYLRHGEAVARIDGQRQALQPHCVLMVAPLSVHGFEFSQDVDGVVLSLAAPLIQQLSGNLGEHQSLLSTTRYVDVTAEHALFDSMFTTLKREYTAAPLGADLLLRSMVLTLLLLLARQTAYAAATSPLAPDRSMYHFAGFKRLLEQRYRFQCAMEEYAQTLGITTAQLNNVCRRNAGRSALQLAHERLLLEAKRNLIYTVMTISQVSDSLGFSEPAYFTRFFKRLTGQSPKTFRMQQLSKYPSGSNTPP